MRELREELGIEALTAGELTRYEFAYPGKNVILLIFIAVAEWQGEVENRIFDAIAWEERPALAMYDFLEGDEPFLKIFTGSPDTGRAAKTERCAPDSASS